MKILVTADCDFRDADILSRCLLRKGHDVLFQVSAATGNFQPDVIIRYGSIAPVVPDVPLVQVRSISAGRLSDDVDLFVFPGKSDIPERFQRRFVVIPQPVNTRMFYPVSQPVEKMILAPGRLNPAMGHKTLVQAMTLVNPDFRAIFAGEEDYYTVEQMQDYARGLGVENRVEFIGEVEDMRSLFRRAAVGVVTSLGNQPVSREGMEIMASGVPLLAAATDGLRDLVTDGVTGLFHSPGNWKQLAGQINHLIENQGFADMLTGNARKYCEKHLSYESVGDRWTEVLEQQGFR